jgi:hypothetical protein
MIGNSYKHHLKTHGDTGQPRMLRPQRGSQQLLGRGAKAVPDPGGGQL